MLIEIRVLEEGGSLKVAIMGIAKQTDITG